LSKGVDIGNKVGLSENIDFIVAYDMNYPIMKGMDKYKRLFICFKLNIIDMKTSKEKKIVATFFQKYTNNYNLWAYGNNNENNIFYYDNYVRVKDYTNLEKRLSLLLEGKPIYNIDFLLCDTINLITGNGNLEITINTDELPIVYK